MSAKVTIAIPTLNRKYFLKDSLSSALAQTYENLEVLVSDNASTDGTAELLASISDPRLRVVRQRETVPMMEHWNKLIELASGEYFLLLSDDDLLAPGAIEKLVSAFDSDIGFVYTNGKIVDSRNRVMSMAPEGPDVEPAADLIVNFLKGNRAVWPCGTLFRKSDILLGYDLHFPYSADAAQWISVACRYGAARYIGPGYAFYRTHQNATMKMPLESMRQENITLGNYAIEKLGQDDGVSLAVRNLNIRITSELINDNLRHEKLLALNQYRKNIGLFFSPYGAKILAKGFALLMLPDVLRFWIRRMIYERA